MSRSLLTEGDLIHIDEEFTPEHAKRVEDTAAFRDSLQEEFHVRLEEYTRLKSLFGPMGLTTDRDFESYLDALQSMITGLNDTIRDIYPDFNI